jgi:Fe-Mn family superoxide dismutase
MAHNNHFFFNCLTPNPTPMPDQLKRGLEASFSSIETLQREFVVTASSMFGPGFVWLVKTKDGKFSLLTTFLAGSPYPGAHYRRQTVDMNTEDNSNVGGNVSEAIRREISGPHRNQVGAFGALSEKQMAPGGIDLTPVLCLNMWEHVYLPDYGVGAFGVGGKKAFAESWWHAIDWSVVANNADIRRPASFLTK